MSPARPHPRSLLASLSFSAKVSCVVLATCTFALVVAGVFALSWTHGVERDELERHLLVSARATGKNIASAILFDDRAFIAEMLESLDTDGYSHVASVWDAAGETLAAHPDAAAAAGLSFGDGEPGTRFAEEHVTVSAPVMLDGERVGTIAVRSDYGKVTDRMRQHGRITAAMILCGALLAYLASLPIARLITRPILRLAAMADTIRERKDYSVRSERESDDEIGRLVSALNEMLETIETGNRQLADKNERLLEARDAAEAANRIKSEFLANMSHELRTPIHGILSFAGFAAKKHASDPDKIPGYCAKIRDSGATLLRLVNDLLDLSKLEAGKMVLDQRPADMRTVVDSVVDEFHSMVSERDIHLNWEAGPTPRPVSVDVERVKQVLRNLLSNAVKFTAPGTAIDVQLESLGENLQTVVRDRGPGIPDGEFELVFDQFVQSSRTKSNAGGTGLGLSICRKIATGHGGRIWAENHPEGGAVFKLTLPSPSGLAAPLPGAASTEHAETTSP